MRTTAEVVAAKIKHVAHRIADGYEVLEEGEGVYMVWDGHAVRGELVEIVASEYGRPYVYPIPVNADPALTAADLVVKYAADCQPL